LSDWLPFLPDSRTFYVPWVRLRTAEGDQAEGPMIRQGTTRRELLTWLSREPGREAAEALIAQAGGSFEIKVMDKKAVQEQCRSLSAWGSPVVAVILKPKESSRDQRQPTL
jgi:hypothetical protein